MNKTNIKDVSIALFLLIRSPTQVIRSGLELAAPE